MSNNDKFDYAYSAPTEKERREIESIKKQYTPTTKKEDKLKELRDLNKRVTRLPVILSFIIGITGTLVLGVGMTMVLEWEIMIWGTVVGLAGALIAAAAYPVFKAVFKRNKKKYGQQIIDLSNALLNIEEK